jgi:ATP-binding cassette subfamily A (ABC1) protein 3
MPTTGTAKILDYDIRKDMDKIRTSIGFCPQYNILYDDLSVDEHLELIAKVSDFQTRQFYQKLI